MAVIRVKFLKGEQIKYISHLDLMRTIHRVIRRAHIQVAYSQGFNPHQEISFGAPLPLGVTSEAEYVDIKMAVDVKPEDLVRIFNENAPEGVKMLRGVVLTPGTKSAMALVTHSEYKLSVVLPDTFSKDPEKKESLVKIHKLAVKELNKKLKEFLELEEIAVIKFNKKTKVEKKLNVRPLIIDCEFEEATAEEVELLADENEVAVIFKCLVKSGSTDNIKPELVVGAFGKFMDANIIVRRIHRTELYKQTPEGLTDLFGNRYLAVGV